MLYWIGIFITTIFILTGVSIIFAKDIMTTNLDGIWLD
jgi:hypothetical protein